MTKKRLFIVVGVIVIALVSVFGYMYNQMQIQMSNEDPLYWENDINEILNRYETTPDVDIVFIGSSSIRKWETLELDFEEYSVVNHGFGGSKLADSTYWYDELVTPFNPEVIVIFSGTNDINGSDGSKSGEEVFNLFKEFYEKSQLENPDIPVYYISISPSKMRWDVWEDVQEANDLIKEYADNQEKLTFIDTTDQLLKDGLPNDDLYVFDGLHLNEDGYKVWTEIIKPLVTETLQ